MANSVNVGGSRWVCRSLLAKSWSPGWTMCRWNLLWGYSVWTPPSVRLGETPTISLQYERKIIDFWTDFWNWHKLRNFCLYMMSELIEMITRLTESSGQKNSSLIIELLLIISPRWCSDFHLTEEICITASKVVRCKSELYSSTVLIPTATIHLRVV